MGFYPKHPSMAWVWADPQGYVLSCQMSRTDPEGNPNPQLSLLQSHSPGNPGPRIWPALHVLLPRAGRYGGMGSSEPCMGWVWGETLLEGCTCRSHEMGQVAPRGNAGSFTSCPHASVCIPRCHRVCSIATPIVLGTARRIRSLHDPCL